MKQPLLNRLSEHVYWLAPDSSTDRPTLGAIVGEQATLIVDAGNSPAHANVLLAELAKLDVAAPKYLVLTHWHWDHVFGLSVFDIPVFAFEETRRMVEEMSRLDWSDEALDRRVEEGTEIEFCRDMIKAELPDRTNLHFKAPNVAFATELEFNLGGVRCLVRHVGGDHSSDSAIVYVREDNIVFLGDCIYEDLHHGPRNYTTAKVLPLIDELVGYDADYYIGGHDPAPMTKEELTQFTDLLQLIGKRVERIGDNRRAVLEELGETSGLTLDEETIEIVDAFLAGLQRPGSVSIAS